MPASYSDWPVAAFVVPREKAEAAAHDPVPPPSKAQVQEWIAELEAEEGEPLPFAEDYPGDE